MTTADQYAYQLVRGFRDAEARLLELIAQTAAKRTHDIHSSQLRDVQKLRRRAERILRSVTDPSPEVIHAMLAEEYADAAARVAGDAFTAGVNIDAVHTITADMVFALQASTLQVLRDVDDVYRRVVARATNAALQSAETHQKALQAALNEAADRGLTAFYDRAGRRWSMDTYLDMALRTTRNRATQEGHIAGYKAAGVELVRASWHRASAPQCYPYQNELLAISGEAGPRVMVSETTGEAITVHVKATMREALEAGYHHPNAILGGEQSIDTFAGTVGASKGTYCGPAFTIRTAQGNTATVSPEHPILTSNGWRTAESIRVGDYLFSTVKGEGSIPVIASESKLKEMPTTVEEEFASLKRNSPSISTPTAGYHFNDDRKFLQGEVHVVVPNDGLLLVPDTEIVKETGEVCFVWPDVGGGEAVGHGGLHSLSHRVAAPIGGALPNGDACLDKPALDGGAAGSEHGGDLLAAKSTLVEGDNSLNVDVLAGLDGRHPGGAETLADGRPGDSKHPSDVCAAVPGVVEMDQVVSVEKFEFRGHAYDFQTELGFYALNGIVVHNCRHRDTPYVPGTPAPDMPEELTEEKNREQYEAQQRQRQLERNVRRWKRREATATTPQAMQDAVAGRRRAQARVREHVRGHGHLSRMYHREQIRQAKGQARIPID